MKHDSFLLLYDLRSLGFKKSDLSPNKITSVGNSIPAFDHLIFVAESQNTVSKHSWLLFRNEVYLHGQH